MAYLRIQRKGKARYYIIVRTERRGEKVVQKVCEYLGRDPTQVRLREALRYWRVKPSPKRKGGGGRG